MRLFLGTTFGYPLYKTGFKTQNCEIKPDLGDLVTIIFNFVPYEYLLSEQNVSEIVKQTVETYPGVRIKVASNLQVPNLPNVEAKIPRPDYTQGILWNKMLHDVKTPYVYLAFDVLKFDDSINFERMVIINSIYYLIKLDIINEIRFFIEYSTKNRYKNQIRLQ